MVGTIVDKLRARNREQIEKVEDRYRRLLQAAVKGERHDITGLSECGDALKIDADAIDGDMKSLIRLNELQASIDRWAGQEAHLQSQTEIARELERLNEARLKLLAQQANANAAQQMLAATRGEMRRLRNDHPRLWPSA